MSGIHHHHPAEDMLWDFYRGALKPGLAMVVRSHLDLCPHCRGDIGLFDAIGSTLLDEVEGVALSDSALELALARIERPEDAATVVAPSLKKPAFLDGVVLPPSLAGAKIHGRRWTAPGVWLARVDAPGSHDASPTYLLRVPAGMAMPEHTHRGREVTMVLKGRFSDANGEYGVGDFTCCDDDDRHSPSVAADGDCICLIAQEAPIVALTWLGRLLQPIARI